MPETVVAKAPVVNVPITTGEEIVIPPKAILIHILEDGFTTNGQLWYRGQEIEYTVGDASYEDTKDRYGQSWLDLDDTGQYRRWGKRMFGFGPWPGESWQDDNSLAAERARGRKPKALGPVAGPRR